MGAHPQRIDGLAAWVGDFPRHLSNVAPQLAERWNPEQRGTLRAAYGVLDRHTPPLRSYFPLVAGVGMVVGEVRAGYGGGRFRDGLGARRRTVLAYQIVPRCSKMGRRPKRRGTPIKQHLESSHNSSSGSSGICKNSIRPSFNNPIFLCLKSRNSKHFELRSDC